MGHCQRQLQSDSHSIWLILQSGLARTQIGPYDLALWKLVRYTFVSYYPFSKSRWRISPNSTAQMPVPVPTSRHRCGLLNGAKKSWLANVIRKR